MTTGTNLQLTYNENTDSWSYQNVNYEYPSSSGNSWSGFTSPDPDFEYVPDTPDTSQPDGDDDPCPAGYIYDNELKQCVPDPNYRAPDYYGAPAPDDTSGRDSTGGNDFIEFDSSTPQGRKAMYEHGLEKGYFTPDAMAGDTSKGGAYEIAGPPETKAWGFIKPIAQFGIDKQYDRWINELNKLNNERLAQGKPAVLAQAIGFFGLSKTFNDWSNYATNINVHSDVSDVSTNVTDVGEDVITSVSGDEIDSEKARITADKKQAEADLAKMEALDKGQSFTDDKGDTYTKVTENQTGVGSSEGYSYTPSQPSAVQNQQYSHPAMGGTSVTVGPRAGVMAEKPRTGPDLTDR